MSLISQAYAQATGLGGFMDGGIVQLMPIAAIVVVFYFMLLRPQQKKAKQHRELLSQLRRGDRIVTGGGIVGTITDARDDGEVQVEIAEGVRVRVLRGSITDVLAKTQPRSAEPADKDDKAKKTAKDS